MYQLILFTRCESRLQVCRTKQAECNLLGALASDPLRGAKSASAALGQVTRAGRDQKWSVAPCMWWKGHLVREKDTSCPLLKRCPSHLRSCASEVPRHRYGAHVQVRQERSAAFNKLFVAQSIATNYPTKQTKTWPVEKQSSQNGKNADSKTILHNNVLSRYSISTTPQPT